MATDEKSSINQDSRPHRISPPKKTSGLDMTRIEPSCVLPEEDFCILILNWMQSHTNFALLSFKCLKLIGFPRPIALCRVGLARLGVLGCAGYESKA